jgi:hypothetical protein
VCQIQAHHAEARHADVSFRHRLKFLQVFDQFHLYLSPKHITLYLSNNLWTKNFHPLKLKRSSNEQRGTSRSLICWQRDDALIPKRLANKHKMPIALQLLLGAISCFALIFLARRLGPKHELRIYAISLIIAALIYVAFTARGATATWLALEIAGAVVFTLLALLGLKISVLILAFAWAAHAAWDVVLHKLTDAAFVPDWYPLACLSFDLLLAGYLVGQAFLPVKRARAR